MDWAIQFFFALWDDSDYQQKYLQSQLSKKEIL